MTEVNDKLKNIKQTALNNQASQNDYSKDIIRYKDLIQKIQDQLQKDKPALDEIDENFQKEKNSIFENEDFSGKDKAVAIRKAFVNCMVEKAKMNRIGTAIVFFDKGQAKFVEVVTVKKFDEVSKQEKSEKMVEYREPVTIRKMIQLEAKRKIKNILPKAQETTILEWLDPYVKTYAPKAEKMFGDYFNVYTPNGFLEVPVKNVIDLDAFTDKIMPERFPIINSLFKNLTPKEEERKYMINWLSYILNTAKKTRNAIALIGIQGSGKGVLQEFLIEYAIHHDNSYTVTNQDIASSFNGYVENRLFLFFNEIKGNFKETSTQADKIKPFITDTKLSVNEKHRKQMYMDNHANCMFFSNHDLPFQIEDKDRRYSVIKTAHRTLKTVAVEDFKLTINEFLKKLESERDDFLIMLKMLKQSKESEELALSLLDNEVKRKIKEQTNTTREIIKEKILDRNVYWFNDTLDELLEGIENDKLVLREITKVVFDETDGEIVKKYPEVMPYTNKQFKQFMCDEVNQGIFTNETLRWFSKIYDIESANSDHKFGKFWNLIINGSEKYSVVEETGKKDKRFRILDIEKVNLNEVVLHGQKFELKEGTARTLIKSNTYS